MDETPEAQAIVRRCQATVIRALIGQCTDAEIARLVADLTRLPPDHPDRGPIATGMVMAVFQGGAAITEGAAPHLGRLLPIADSAPPPHPQWPKVRSVARVQILLHGGLRGEHVDLDLVEDEMAPIAATLAANPQTRPYVESMRLAAEAIRAIENGDEGAVHRMPGEMRKHLDQLGDDPRLTPLMRSLDVVAQLLAANQRGDHTAMMRGLEQFQESTRGLAPDDPVRQAAEEVVARATPLFGAFGADGGMRSPEELARLEERLDRPGDSDYDRATNHLSYGGALLAGGRETDLARIESAVEHFRQALRLLPEDHPQHAFAMHSVALGQFRRSEVAGNVDGLAEAAQLLERECELLGGPHHRNWSDANGLLAEVRSRLGEARSAGEVGLVAQRGLVWRVLLESDATGAKIALRDATGSAIGSARRCLQSDDITGALRALDTCRGLMLLAATEWHKMPARLAAAGRLDLARRWAEEDRNTSALRREVLTVLSRQPETADSVMVDPPGIGEIRSALAALEADALVYLVPADPPQPGLAVIAMADGRQAWMSLPNLAVGPAGGVDVERYLAALADRSRDLAAEHVDDRLAGSVDTLCDWAWRVAMGPVLDQVTTLRAGAPTDRVPRIVLIPMGDLARIPWQAARRHDGVYAVELAAFSQAVSARLLCENAARTPVTLSSGGLVVSDPDTDGAARPLEDGRVEAHAVRGAFYRGARLIGRRPNGTVSPSGRGTAAEVRRWLADEGPAAGVMLHLACHGSFAVGLEDADSTLLLASAPGDEGPGDLSAEEILDLLGAVPNRRVALVVLAACNTGRSVHGYDEAYSLGTAFLAGRACSVLSTQWSIPDAQTPSLMYLFHHYVRREGMPPWQALRQAQIWMLDPKRQPPDGMPADLLRSLPVGESAPVVSWAGFVHYGH